MRIKYIFCLFLFIQSINIFAQEQHPDYLIYNGITYEIYENPMEEYFNEFPRKRPNSGYLSSNLWRGYVATFEIINNELWVIDIEVYGELVIIDGRWITGLTSVIRKYLKTNKMKVDWFNGLIFLTQGRYIKKRHVVTEIEIEKGNIVSEYNLDLRNDFNYEEYQDKLNEFNIIRRSINTTETMEKNMIGLILAGIGVIALILVIVFKKNINSFYDNMKGLSESHAKYYKNIVVFLLPAIFIVMGLYFFIS
jgi:hypothetical protein